MVSIAIIDVRSGLSLYLQEILRAWGLGPTQLIQIDELDVDLHSVVVCPKADLRNEQIDHLVRYAESGGTVIAISPSVLLANMAGAELGAECRHGPLRLRVHGLTVRGLQGESLPIVGPAQWARADDEDVLASMFVPGEFKGEDHETPGIVSSAYGDGRVTAVLFDLPRCVMMLRQGDPAQAGRQFESESITRRSCKPTNLATDIGPDDSGQIPFADLLGRVLVDLVLNTIDVPMPMLSVFPAEAKGVLLMSGDEDNADVEANDEQMSKTTGAGGRMNLYMIPNLTQSSAKDVQRYSRAHDLGPHPNLVPMCDELPEVRIAEYENQIKQFETMFGLKARSIRNHAAGWVGYLDLVAIQERCGIRMDANYFSGGIFRERNQAPFSPFGGAMPMRFTEPDGRLYDVFQQHTQLNDDVWFAPDRPYSYKYTQDVAAPMMRRVFTQLVDRFRMPLTSNFHPGNWYFAKGHALALMDIAQKLGAVCWSLDQWLAFWEARDLCSIDLKRWDGGVLGFEVFVNSDRDDLCVELPMSWRGRTLKNVECEDKNLDWQVLEQFEGDLVRLPILASGDRSIFEVTYQ